MEVKKYPKYDLENYRSIFFLVGLVFALAVMYGMFQYKTYNAKVEDIAVNDEGNFEQEDIPITRNDVELPPPPPPQQQVSDVLEIVNDDTKLEDDFNFDVESDEDESIQFTDVDLNDDEGETEDDQIFISVQQMPEFPGGQMALRRYIAEHIQYPVLARENDIEGVVTVQFVVGKKGEVSNVFVIRGVDPLLDSEAVRVVKSLPRFKPGMQQGRPVKVWFTLPIVFKLQK